MFHHADNCTGQNKNNYVLWYLLWRAITGRHTNITLSFLVVGHTKFAPDWCFGLFKRLFKRTKVGSLKSIAEVVQRSGKCNEAQLVVNEEGSVIVLTYDWASFFAPRFKKLPNIKKGHHFRFSSSHPGVVYTKERTDDTSEARHDLLKEGATFDDHSELPDVIVPAGLSAQRQWYLYDKIREFCPVSDRDLTCPLPSVPKPTSCQDTPEPPASPLHPARPLTQPPSQSQPPPAKRPRQQRSCKKCGQPGHNSRTCSRST